MTKLNVPPEDEQFEDDTKVAPPPHIAVLTDRQRKFVNAFLATGNATEAALTAGYGGKDGKYGSQRGYELMRTQKVRDAITAEQLAHGHALRSRALKVWQDELDRPSATLDDRKLKLAAAKEVADRFGLVRVTKSEGVIEHKHQFENMPTDEIEAFIRSKIKASKLIDDAEYTEIDAATKDISIPPFHELKGLPAPVAGKEFDPTAPVYQSTEERELAELMGAMPAEG